MVLSLVLIVMSLAACGKNTSEELQSKKWNVVATNGESYTAEFGTDTATFKLGMFTVGMNYKIDGDEFSMTGKEKGPYIYTVKKDGKEYRFEAKNSETKDRFGDLTLSPSCFIII